MDTIGSIFSVIGYILAFGFNEYKSGLTIRIIGALFLQVYFSYIHSLGLILMNGFYLVIDCLILNSKLWR